MSHLAVSADPLSPPTVENLTITIIIIIIIIIIITTYLTASGVCFPTLLKMFALQRWLMS